MTIFILIFFAALIAVGLSTVLGFSFYLKRRTKHFNSNNQKQFIDEPPYQSLFAPTDDEIVAFERDERLKAESEKQAATQKILLEKAEITREFQKIWQENSTKKNTVELLFLAAQSESAKVFSETAESVIKVWREKKAENLTAHDLADLLDSHLGLLSQQERASGEVFWLKQEIESLRRKSEEN
jgi:hypothetical protein